MIRIMPRVLSAIVGRASFMDGQSQKPAAMSIILRRRLSGNGRLQRRPAERGRAFEAWWLQLLVPREIAFNFPRAFRNDTKRHEAPASVARIRTTRHDRSRAGNDSQTFRKAG